MNVHHTPHDPWECPVCRDEMQDDDTGLPAALALVLVCLGFGLAVLAAWAWMALFHAAGRGGL